MARRLVFSTRSLWSAQVMDGPWERLGVALIAERFCQQDRLRSFDWLPPGDHVFVLNHLVRSGRFVACSDALYAHRVTLTGAAFLPSWRAPRYLHTQIIQVGELLFSLFAENSFCARDRKFRSYLL